MTDDEQDQAVDRLYNLFGAIKNAVQDGELHEWQDTLADLDFAVAMRTIDAGKREWWRLPSHAQFRGLYDTLAPPRPPANTDSFTCAGGRYVLADPLLADDFGTERQRTLGPAGDRVASLDCARTWRARIADELAGSRGPLARSLLPAALDEQRAMATR